MVAALQINVFKKSRKDLGLTLPSEVGIRRLSNSIMEAKATKKKCDAFTMDIVLDFSDVKYLESIIDKFYEELKTDPAYRDSTVTTVVEPSTVDEVLRLAVLNNIGQLLASPSIPMTIDEVIES